jgi:hypothetical protein
MDSEYAAGFLRFWKGRYFVSILADRETPESKAAVLAIGRAIDSAIKDTGARPAIVDLLPQKDLLPTSVRYFHKKSGLDYHYFLADANILNLDERTEAVLAQCKRGKAKSQLLLVRYPSPDLAESAFTSFLKAYMPDAHGKGIVRTENGKWAAAIRRDSFVAAVFDSATRTRAEQMMKEVAGKLEVREK